MITPDTSGSTRANSPARIRKGRLPPFLLVAVLAAWVLASRPVLSQTLPVCYNWGCFRQAAVEISPATRAQIAGFFLPVTSAPEEREALRHAVRQLYLEAARFAPIAADRGGNLNDSFTDGRMDCVDHSRNNLVFLTYLQQQGWLRYHRVAGIASRAPWLINRHYASQITETATDTLWVVDSWFADFGKPAAILLQEEWQQGYSP